MITNAKFSKLIKQIELSASKTSMYDKDPDANIMDYAGGNFDDAFSMGIKVGEIDFARSLKSILDEED